MIQNFITLVALLVGITPLTARQINWRSLANQNNLTSDGTSFPAGFQFELGCFNDTFVPNRANAADWASHWSSVARTSYRMADKAFSSAFFVDSNQAPLLLGKQAYIWGYRVDGVTNEWILVTASTWLWPSPSFVSAPLLWVVNSSVTVIVGSVGASTSSVYLRSETVNGPLPVTLPQVWRNAQFAGESEAISAWTEDPDGDGLSNQYEYALGTDPWNPEGNDSLELTVSDVVEIHLKRSVNRLAIAVIEVSNDIEEWGDPPALQTQVLKDRLDSQLVEASGDVVRLFFRAHVEWPPGVSP